MIDRPTMSLLLAVVRYVEARCIWVVIVVVRRIVVVVVGGGGGAVLVGASLKLIFFLSPFRSIVIEFNLPTPHFYSIGSHIHVEARPIKT